MFGPKPEKVGEVSDLLDPHTIKWADHRSAKRLKWKKEDGGKGGSDVYVGRWKVSVVRERGEKRRKAGCFGRAGARERERERCRQGPMSGFIIPAGNEGG